MSEHFFGLGPAHLSSRVADIARRHGAALVNYTDCGTGEERHWFAGPNRGEPFDSALMARVLDAVETECGRDWRTTERVVGRVRP